MYLRSGEESRKSASAPLRILVSFSVCLSVGNLSSFAPLLFASDMSLHVLHIQRKDMCVYKSEN